MQVTLKINNVGVGTTVFRYTLTSSDITVDQQGGGSVGAGATGMFVSSTVGLNTIGVGTGNIIRLGTELIGIGETINSSTNFVGFSTRGLDNTTAGRTHNDGATVRVYTNAGAATTIRESGDGTTTSLAVNAIGGFRANDLGRLGDTISGEIILVTGVTTSASLTPDTVKTGTNLRPWVSAIRPSSGRTLLQNLVLLTTQQVVTQDSTKLTS